MPNDFIVRTGYIPPPAASFGAEAEMPIHWAIRSDCPGRVLELVEDGHSVNARNKENKTPLMICCEQGGRKAYACAQILLKHDADIEASTHRGFSPLTIADSCAQDKLSSLIRSYSSPEWIEEEKCYQIRKLVAHIHGVVASSFGTRPLGFSYLPVIHRLFSEKLSAFLEADSGGFSPKEKTELETVMANSGSDISFVSFSRRIDYGQPVVIISGWKEHFLTLIFYKNVLMIANRGERDRSVQTLEVFLIDPKRMNESLLRDIQNCDSKSKGEGSALIYFGLRHILSIYRQPTPEEDRLLFAVKRFAPKSLKEDICAWAALKEGLRIVGTCMKTRTITAGGCNEQALRVKAFCKRFSTALRKGSLLVCKGLEATRDVPDKVFLAAVEASLERRLKKYPSHEGIRPLLFEIEG